MNEFKGTQGEWSVSYKVYQNEHGASYVEIDCMKNGSGVTGLALVYEGITEYGLMEMHANAQLISKAPELLAFIEKKYRYLNLDDQQEARDLIKQATEVTND